MGRVRGPTNCPSSVANSPRVHLEVHAASLDTEVEHPGYFEMWAGVCLGLLDLACPDGTLDYEVAADWSSIRARFTW